MRQNRIQTIWYPGQLENKPVTHPHCPFMFLTKFWERICKSLRAYCLSNTDLLAVWTRMGRILCYMSPDISFVLVESNRKNREVDAPPQLLPFPLFLKKDLFFSKTWSDTGKMRCLKSLDLSGIFGQHCVLESTSCSDCFQVYSLSYNEDSAR